MKIEEIRSLETEQLQGKVKELKQDLFTMRFQQATGQLENLGTMKDVKKSIARILTVIRQREMLNK